MTAPNLSVKNSRYLDALINRQTQTPAPKTDHKPSLQLPAIVNGKENQHKIAYLEPPSWN